MNTTRISPAPGPETMRLGNKRDGGKLQVGRRPFDLNSVGGLLFTLAVLAAAFIAGLSALGPERWTQ